MSNVEREPAETRCGSGLTTTRGGELVPAREVPLGGPRAIVVRRTLPSRTLRTVGAWCFLDHYGPVTATGGPVMDVPPHPHTGLQTVSWLVSGEVMHRDSLGSRQLIRPGELAVMTAGHGIAHSETSVADAAPTLHGVQLWVALPEPHRHRSPGFAHCAVLPGYDDGGVRVTVILGSLGGQTSPGPTYSPLLGAELAVAPGGSAVLPLEPWFEHAALALDGEVAVDGQPLTAGPLLYLGRRRRDVAVSSGPGGRLLLLGGTPFEEELVMWWNFVGRSHDEVAAAREDWQAGRRFGEVGGYPGRRLAAPAMPATRLRPRPSTPR